MENTDIYKMSSFLLESEEDFPLGAKTISFLPSATVSNATNTSASFELPEWMESRENLGLANVELFEDLSFPLSINSTGAQAVSVVKEEQLKMEEDYYSTIKPEDMLVPLSELQPVHSLVPQSPLQACSPPATPVPQSPLQACSPPATPVPQSLPQAYSPPATPPLQKIILCKKVVTSSLKTKPSQVYYQVMPAKHGPDVSCTPLGMQEVPQASSSVHGMSQMAQVNNIHMDAHEEVNQPCDAEELINEMVQMIGNGTANNTFVGLEDTSLVEAGMEDLLSQLETSESSVIGVKPPYPVPSFGSLSPSSSTSTFVIESSSPVSLPSPVPSFGSLSPSPSTSDSIFISSPSCEVFASSPQSSECFDDDWSQLEEAHSYSRSRRKSKSALKSSNRKTPYLEDRRERKKEQNKQAALRYRHKKKQEEDEQMAKIQAEESRQKELKAKYIGLKQELTYLKKIMREVFIAKGLLSEEALKKAAVEKNKRPVPLAVQHSI